VNPAEHRPRLPASVRIAAKGFCMGCADVVPGVSGGTMALFLGIYERLLNAIRSFDLGWLKQVLRLRWRAALAGNDLPFLVPLLAGIVCAFFVFTRVIPLPWLVQHQPEIIYGLFFGLIVASIVILLREVEHFGLRDFAIMLAGVVAGWFIVTLVPMETPDALWFIYLCGFIAISAMLLPGISGSFILLILGKYAYVLNALAVLDLPVLLTFIAGLVSGLVVFSNAVSWLLRQYRRSTLLVIEGVLIGSLWVIWPFRDSVYVVVRDQQRLISTTPVWPQEWNGMAWLSLGLMLLGFVAVMWLEKAARPGAQDAQRDGAG
jgi:putative membrane protein